MALRSGGGWGRDGGKGERRDSDHFALFFNAKEDTKDRADPPSEWDRLVSHAD